jgi:5-methyltetrahydropteroyltriglutamate--homocysteine methyltransferase
MKHSTHRILTTHVGSLPRPPDLLALIQTKEHGAPFEAELYSRRVETAVVEVVKKQAEAGIDIVADGEMGRFGFIPYVNERLAGIEPRPNPVAEGTWARSREDLAFPEYYAWAAQMPGAAGGSQRTRWVCTGPIAYQGHEALARDINNLKAALAEVNCEEAFMPAVSPASSPVGTGMNSTGPMRNFASPSPMRCTRSIGRSSMPAWCCRSTTHSWRAITRRTRNSTLRNAATGRMPRSRC